VALSYTDSFTFEATLRGQPLQVVSKPGLEGGHEVGGPAALAAELIAPASSERTLLLGCGHGALAVALARQLDAGRLTVSDPSLIALRMAARTLAANRLAGVTVSQALSLLPEGAGSFDRVVILAPQSRALARRWLVEAQKLLRPGGALNIAGANGGGIQSLIADAAALFGAATTLGYGRGSRVGEALRQASPPPPPPWTLAPGIAPGSWLDVAADLPGGPVTLASLPGVFSADRLDAGTALLLQHSGLGHGLRVLDAGCGYGPIGVAAARLGAAQVDMLDVNLLAVAAAQENIHRLGLANAAALPSDALEAAAGRRYDLVISNPPFHAGKAVDAAMADAFISQARGLLAAGGRLALVANRFLPYERRLAPLFPRVEVAAESRSYRVLVGHTS
jgi:16S rRNA (guanine1207-N2)-methyltransferase